MASSMRDRGEASRCVILFDVDNTLTVLIVNARSLRRIFDPRYDVCHLKHGVHCVFFAYVTTFNLSYTVSDATHSRDL